MDGDNPVVVTAITSIPNTGRQSIWMNGCIPKEAIDDVCLFFFFFADVFFRPGPSRIVFFIFREGPHLY